MQHFFLANISWYTCFLQQRSGPSKAHIQDLDLTAKTFRFSYFTPWSCDEFGTYSLPLQPQLCHFTSQASQSNISYSKSYHKPARTT